MIHIIAQTDSILVADTIPQYTHEAIIDSNLPMHYQFHWEDRISRMRRFNKFSYLFVQYGINIQGIFPGIRYTEEIEYSLPVQGFYIRPMYLNIELGIHIKNHRISIGTDLQRYIYGFKVENQIGTMIRNIDYLHYLRRYYLTYGYQFFHDKGWFIFTPGISLGFTDQFQSFFATNNSIANYAFNIIDSSFYASYSLGYDIKQSFVIAPMLDFTFQPGRIFAFFVNLSLPMSTDATYTKGSYVFQGETPRPIHAINSIRSINILFGGRLKFYFPKELDKARKPKNQ